jgi:hypothetical protein
MSRKNHPKHHRHDARRPSSSAAARTPLPKPERKPPVIYGRPFIVLEDEAKNTFTFDGGTWVPHSMTIAQCRVECQVKELPQKVNRMIRYEVRCPETQEF